MLPSPHPCLEPSRPWEMGHSGDSTVEMPSERRPPGRLGHRGERRPSVLTAGRRQPRQDWSPKGGGGDSHAAPKGALANDKSAPTRDHSTPSGSGQGTGELAGPPGGGPGPELDPPSGDGGGAGDTVPRGLEEPPTAPFLSFVANSRGTGRGREEDRGRSSR